ncbi:MipA/OmpV family protein [Hydrogenophaga sp. NFH-34]|uniref:MipA/OmpV family protein n=1 Tax=Hydrogenophaga sp. NFH-34 TaxID=2744446 RepID=UPI001F18539B|nr:MipA/OmpV family protein [Hydrogenophaga sp. NFH-34]
MKRSSFACVLAALALARTGFAAEDKPLWEVGLGVGAVSFPAYRGSDQSQQYVLPTPYFIYHGRFLKADRHGVRGQLFASDRVDLTVSGALSPPAPSRRIDARAGMPDLEANFEIGPELDLTLWTAENQRRQLKLQLPLRVAHTLDRDVRNIGWVFHPKLNLDLQDLPGLPGWNVGLQAGPLFGDRRQHQYFYGVDAAYATPDRPAYRAGAGFAGMQYLAAISRRYDRYWIGAFLRYDNLSGATFADSPLVRTRHYVAGGVAISWILGQSSTRVVADD